LILRKIIKIVATRCQVLRLKCTKFDFDFGWGSAQTPLGKLTALPRPPSCDALLLREEGRAKERRGERREGRGGRGGERREERGREGRGKECVLPPVQSYFDHWSTCSQTTRSVREVINSERVRKT